MAVFARAAAARPDVPERRAADLARPVVSPDGQDAADLAQPVVSFVESAQQAARPVCPEQPAADLAQPAASPDGRDAADLARRAESLAEPAADLAQPVAPPDGRDAWAAGLARLAFAAVAPMPEAERSVRRAEAAARCVLPPAAVAVSDVSRREAAAVPDGMRPEAEERPAVWPRRAAAVPALRPEAVRRQPAASPPALRPAVHLPFSSPRGPVLAQASFRTARIEAIARPKAT